MDWTSIGQRRWFYHRLNRKGVETDHVLQYIALSKLRAVSVVSINTFLATLYIISDVTITFSNSTVICLV